MPATQARATRLTSTAQAAGVIDWLNRASLRLRFNENELDPRVLCGRSSQGTYWDKDGVLQTAAIGVPRITYDPADLSAPPGLLAEEARKNQIRNSTMQGAVAGTPGTLTTNWQTTTGGLSFNVIGTGSEGGINYVDVRFVGTTTASGFNLRFDASNTIAASNSQTWTSSFFCRQVAGTLANITGITNTITFRDSTTTTLTANVTSIVSGLSATSLSVARSSTTFTATNASTAFTVNAIGFSSLVGATIDITLRIGLPQLELGASASSPIPTFGAAATRAADNLSMTDMSWYQQSGGVLYVEGVNYSSGGLVGIDDGTNNNRARLGHSGGTAANVVLAAGGVLLINSNGPPNSLPLGQNSKQSLRLQANNHAWVQGGVVRATGVTGALPATPNRLTVGFGQASLHSNVLIREIAFIPNANISDRALQALTK
jgi:hypothetical protein